MISLGSFSDGAVVSTTVTVNDPAAMLPEASVAVQLTAVVLSSAKLLPDPGVQATTGDPAIAFVRVFEDSADELMAAQPGCLHVSVLAERQLVQNSTREQVSTAIVAWQTAQSHQLREALKPRLAAPAIGPRRPSRPPLRHLRRRVHPGPVHERQPPTCAQLTVPGQLIESLLFHRQAQS